MQRNRDVYVKPVGFAREPREDKRRVVVRLVTVILMGFILWLFVERVWKAPEDSFQPSLGVAAMHATAPPD